MTLVTGRANGSQELATTTDLPDPTALADRLALVAEGIYGAAQSLGRTGPASQGRVCAETLIGHAIVEVPHLGRSSA